VAPTPKPAERRAPDHGLRNMVDLTDIDLYVSVGFYFIHVGSYKSGPSAEGDARILNLMGFESRIVFVDLGDRGGWYRLYAGPIASKADADALLSTLESDLRFPSPRLIGL
jgi:hypothetical protein